MRHPRNCRLRLAALAALGLCHATASAKGIPWNKLKDTGQLLRSERETAATVMQKTRCYHGCADTVASCLLRRPRAPVAWRLANYVVFLAGKGLDEKEIAALLSKRRDSALPSKAHRIGLTNVARIGRSDAKVTLVEYADFQCGHCAHVSPILERLAKKRPKDVALYFKPYPLRPGKSVVAARAALAAQRQGKFWTLAHLLFANPDQHTASGVASLAAKAGLEISRFKRDFGDKSLLSIIDANKVEGLRLGVKGTPAVFVNGKPYHLQKDERHLRDRIEEELEMTAPPRQAQSPAQP